MNSTVYGLPDEETVRSLVSEVTDSGFVFSVKASRYIAHMKKLKSPDDAVARLMSSVGPLGERAGVVLFQLPPRWPQNVERLETFLKPLHPAMRSGSRR